MPNVGSWRRRRFPDERYGRAILGSSVGEVAVVQPQPRRPGGTRAIALLLITITLAALGLTANAYVSGCVSGWNAALYRPDDLGALSLCLRGEAPPRPDRGPP